MATETPSVATDRLSCGRSSNAASSFFSIAASCVRDSSVTTTRTWTSGAFFATTWRDFFERRDEPVVATGADVSSSSLAEPEPGSEASDGTGGKSWFGAAAAVVGLMTKADDEPPEAACVCEGGALTFAGSAANAVPHARVAVQIRNRSIGRPPVTRSV
ncbi:protein of unknown function [Paraburkholderia kururiensis]